MINYILTGKTIKGNYIHAPRRSCRTIDRPTKQRITVTLNGTEYNRAIYERIIWRNGFRTEIIARFVIINNTNYEIAEA